MKLKAHPAAGMILASFAALFVFGLPPVDRSRVRKPQIIALIPTNFDFPEGSVDFSDYDTRKSLKIKRGDVNVVLKNFDFVRGTIEYDFEPVDNRFVTLFFRYQSASENESFYFRTARAASANSEDAVQYTPTVKGVSLWDLMYHYQTHARFEKGKWNHVKMVVNGQQLRVYVNDSLKPTLSVTHLEGDVKNGTLAFLGESIISNLVIKRDAVEDLSPGAIPDETLTDRRYLRNWEVSEPVETGKAIDFNQSWMPNSSTRWTPIESEYRGLINLSRRFGQTNTRRITWLRTTIKSRKTQKKKVDLGFSDEIWLFVNGKLLLTDKNGYFNYTQKHPQGRCSLENLSTEMPLTEGSNIVMVGVANDFYGWGFVARLKDLEDVDVKTE